MRTLILRQPHLMEHLPGAWALHPLSSGFAHFSTRKGGLLLEMGASPGFRPGFRTSNHHYPNPMQPKILLVSNDPGLRLRMQIGLEGAEIKFARDEYEARRVLETLRNEDTPSTVQTPQEGPWTRPGEILPFEEYERRILQHALTTTGWNVKQAAARLGIGRATLYRKIDRYDLRGRNAG